MPLREDKEDEDHISQRSSSRREKSQVMLYFMEFHLW